MPTILFSCPLGSWVSLLNFETIRVTDENQLVWPRKFAHSSFSSLGSLIRTDNLFKHILDFTTTGDWDCVAAVGRLPALHYSVDFIFLSIGIMGFIAIRGLLIRPKWPKLASQARKTCTL